MYNYPERMERSLRWVAVHTMHEVRHHTLDVRNQLEVGPGTGTESTSESEVHPGR